MLNTNNNPITPSYFKIPDEALSIARNMLAREGEASYRDLHQQFMSRIPEGKECFFCVDYESVQNKVNESILLGQKNFLTLYDPEEDLIAAISKDDVLYKEDFADLMKSSGLEATEQNFQKVWLMFPSTIPSEMSLREVAAATVKSVKDRSIKPSLAVQLRSAESRASAEHSESREKELMAEPSR